jgi:hypothetical protein
LPNKEERGIGTSMQEQIDNSATAPANRPAPVQQQPAQPAAPAQQQPQPQQK